MLGRFIWTNGPIWEWWRRVGSGGRGGLDGGGDGFVAPGEAWLRFAVLKIQKPRVWGGWEFDRAGEEYFAGWCFLRAVGSVLFALLMQS
jgi:hypothetical protein